MAQVIVIGGGLAGLSAAHTVLERGGRVLVIDKNPFMGGNSTKATSGINGTLTRTQIKLGIKDSPEVFAKDTAVSAAGGKADAEPTPIAQVLAFESAPAVHWLQDRFKLDLSLISRLGGHSFPRTHRGKEKFPGMTITYALMSELERIAELKDGRARILLKSRVTKLLTDANGTVTGVEYEHDGKTAQEHGPVVVATGGYAADFAPDSILGKIRPDLLHLPTTNGDHCTGDGIKFSDAIGADVIDLEHVQVHPTGLVHPDDPNAKVKFLAAEALRGVGGLLLDANGKRFCNELGRRDYVSGEMRNGKNKGPFRLVLNSKGGKEIEWHCKHYQGRGLMKHFNNAAELAKEIGCPVSNIEQTFSKYNSDAKANNDQFGKKYFQNMPWDTSDNFWVAIVTPVLHYCMGGLKVSPAAEVISKKGSPVAGLFATGEVMGGVHGVNRLGGSSLLDCVVFGRVAGDSVSKYLLDSMLRDRALNRVGALAGHFAPVNITVSPNNQSVTLQIQWNGQGSSAAPSAPAAAPVAAAAATPAAAASAAPAAAPAAAAKKELKEYTMAEVAKHNTASDCWVVVNGRVLDATKFLPDHPGGAKAIVLFAGKDATEEFNMLHQADVVDKYAPNTVIGKLKK